MKKVYFAIMFILLSSLVGCTSASELSYSDNAPVLIEMKQEDLKILQLTDVHLTFGIDYNDRQTFKAIENMVLHDDWDLVVFTGDIVLSPLAVPLFKHLVNLMESLGVHWTFILGNHDRDYHLAKALLKVIEGTKYLRFKVGPELEDGGIGNFKITFTKNNEPFYNLYFLDTKSNTDHPNRVSDYDYLSTAQVAWYEDFIQMDDVDNLVFMHIPLIQFQLVETYEGIFGEPVHPQGIDTGFFDSAVHHGLTKGIFVGHDHDNDFSFMLQGVLLAYGRYSGYNGYGFLEIGGRVIKISADKQLSTYILPLSEVNA